MKGQKYVNSRWPWNFTVIECMHKWVRPGPFSSSSLSLRMRWGNTTVLPDLLPIFLNVMLPARACTYTRLTLEKIRGRAWDDFTHDTVALWCHPGFPSKFTPKLRDKIWNRKSGFEVSYSCNVNCYTKCDFVWNIQICCIRIWTF